MKILAAIDGSRSASSALRFAIALARACRAEVVAVIVGDFPARLLRSRPRPFPSPTDLEEKERAWAGRTLAAARVEARRAGVRVRCKYARARELAPTAETIVREADREHADLIVVGSSSTSLLARWALGSVAHRLTHVARRPVAVVRSWKRTGSGPWRILVGTDGSRAAAQAVKLGAALAGRIGKARLAVVTVSTLAADLALAGRDIVAVLGMLPDLERAEKKAAERILAGAARAAGPRASLTARYPKTPVAAARILVREAAALRADMILLGGSGRTSLGEMMLGSVAQQVLSLSRCPVVLVRGRR